MSEPKGPSIEPKKSEREPAAGGRSGLSPFGLALAGSLAVHLAVAAALFAHPAEPPAPQAIIAVEIVKGPPGQNAARKAASVAAAPGASAKPTSADPAKPADRTKVDTEPAHAKKTPVEKTPPKPRQLAEATPPDRPHDKAAPETPPKSLPDPAPTPEAARRDVTPPPAEATPVPPAEVARPDTPKSVPEPQARPPKPAPDRSARPAEPAPAPVETARTGRVDAPKVETEAPPRTVALAVRPKVKPKSKPEPRRTARNRQRPQPRRQAVRKTPPKHTARAPAPQKTARRAERKKADRRRTVRRNATRRDTTRRQTASAPAGVLVPPRPGRGTGRNRPPAYPRRAQREGWQGRVLLFVRVTAQGRVAAVQVRRSSGHGILDRAALRAVRGWHFTPARRGRTPVAGSLVVPVRFRLTN